MTRALAPLPISVDDPLPSDPQAVVEAFLAALADENMAVAEALAAHDIAWVNVGLPTVRGRERVIKALSALARPGFGFEVYLHAISAAGGTVLTDRTDVMIVGPVRVQFWVAGRFEVEDGEVRLWRDSFDYIDIVRATVRGLVGALVPPLRPAAPQGLDSTPGQRPFFRR